MAARIHPMMKNIDVFQSPVFSLKISENEGTNKKYFFKKKNYVECGALCKWCFCQGYQMLKILRQEKRKKPGREYRFVY